MRVKLVSKINPTQSYQNVTTTSAGRHFVILDKDEPYNNVQELLVRSPPGIAYSTLRGEVFVIIQVNPNTEQPNSNFIGEIAPEGG